MKTRRMLLIGLGFGLLLLSQIACESTAGPGLTCSPPLARTCHVDDFGVQACWCQ